MSLAHSLPSALASLDAVDLRSRARGRVFVVTGAGISADSGLSTFRGAGGLWNDPALARLATPEAFHEDPDGVLAWYGLRREKASAAEPSDGHRAIARFGRAAQSTMCLTQNVDDLHERGGLSEDQIVHIHGRLHRTRCVRCGRSWPEPVTASTSPSSPAGTAPCSCDARRRPDVVWFGEQLPHAEVMRVEDFLLAGPCDLVLVVGTTAGFPYIVRWSLQARGRWGSPAERGLLVEVNPEPTELSVDADVVIRERAAVALPALADAAGVPS